MPAVSLFYELTDGGKGSEEEENLNVRGALGCFLINKCYVYIQRYSPKHIVCIL